MLDGMRRHKGWLKWSLALVCLAFVFLYVPGFVDQTALEGMPNDVLARVGDHEITVARFRQLYLAQLQSYRLQSSGEVTEEVLRSLGIDRQILQALNRLVLGSATSKLLVGPQHGDATSVLSTLQRAAAACSGQLFLALAPLDSAPDAAPRMWRFREGRWNLYPG